MKSTLYGIGHKLGATVLILTSFGGKLTVYNVTLHIVNIYVIYILR